MKWWQLPSNGQCLFAIDSETIYTPTTLILNNTSKIVSILGTPGSVKASITSGYYTKNYDRPNSQNIEMYKCLTITSDLKFNSPIVRPNNFTFILKCKVYEYINFLTNITSESSLYKNPGDNIWRSDTNVITSSSDYSSSVRMKYSRDNIEQVVLRCDTANNRVDIITDYGSYTAAIGGSFFNSPNYNMLRGYSNRSFNSDIIAYGMFDKYLSDKEISEVFSSIDAQFKHKTISPLFVEEEVISKLPLGIKYVANFQHTPVIKPLNTSTPSFKKLNQTSLYLTTTFSNPQTYFENYLEIEDIVLEEGLPVRVLLYLYEKTTGELVSTTLSNLKGEFKFTNLNADMEYTITARDKKYQFQSIIKDYNKGDKWKA